MFILFVFLYCNRASPSYDHVYVFQYPNKKRKSSTNNEIVNISYILSFSILFCFWVNRKPTHTGFYCPFKVKCIQLLTSAFASLESIGLMYFVYLKVSFNGSSNCQKLCWGRKAKFLQLKVYMCYRYRMYQAIIIM